MALIKPNVDRINSRVVQVQWFGVTENDTCISWQSNGYSDRSVQVVGTFAGGTVNIEGSENNSNFAILSDNLGNALSFTSTGAPVPIAAACLWTKPVITGGSGNSLNILITCTTSGD